MEAHPMLSDLKIKDGLSLQLRLTDNRTLEFFIALGLLFILGLLRQIFPQYLANLLGSVPLFGNNKRSQSGQLANDGKASLGFYLLYLINLTYLVFTTFRLFTPFSTRTIPELIGISLGCVFLAVGIKTILSSFVAWVFKQEESAKLYRFNNAKVNEFTGMFLFPISLLVLLTHDRVQRSIAILALIVLCFSILIKYIRNLGLINNLFRIDFLHFLLYLCAFEIVPVVVLVKVVVGH